MADPASVLCEIADGVAIVRLNRPGRLNALTLEMLERLQLTLADVVAQGARALLLTGAGTAFCSGADLSPPADADEAAAMENALQTHYNPLMAALADLPIPVVTAINGAAAGAGVSIALAGDIVVAARSPYLLLAFANIRLVPDAGATWLVAKAAGRARLLEMALLGEQLDAVGAYEAGLINRVVEDAELADVAIAHACKLAAMPTIAMGLIRKQAMLALTGTFREVMELEAMHQRIASRSEDFAEGIAAFAQKRAPVFTGR